MPESRLQGLIDELQGETALIFKVGEESFNKLEVASVGFGSWSVQLTHGKLEVEEKS